MSSMSSMSSESKDETKLSKSKLSQALQEINNLKTDRDHLKQTLETHTIMLEEAYKVLANRSLLV